MVLSREEGPSAHPFWYVQVLRAFLIPVVHVAPDVRNCSPQTMEVLWVRWLGIELGYRGGFKNPFGFLDLSLVICGCHLIPAFSEGRTDTLLRREESFARQPGETDDWCAFYVNIFVDRDMFSHFAGIGIGHGTQCRIQLMDGITGNMPKNATFLVADSEDEANDIFHTGQESLSQVPPPHDNNTGLDNDHDDDDDGESDSKSMLFDGLELDGSEEDDDESDFEF
ncbi:hypothetical protein SCLCIDRAFT_30082 [Scleroderma citrinum Foug A]|uniref:Uncharacterized protein n=1 Tax=Scleroderma citrinum Foug A TaxID=1036808 RepID=A0A0C2Z1W2_9AGAM|nr:hypothetical protein SCLCIDRAFT_30082 [Scleroderma citrinum Foug A]